MKNAKHPIAIFYVALLLLFKVSGLHALAHHDGDSDVQHCEVCHITTAVSFTPLLETESPVLPQTKYFFSGQNFNNAAPYVVFNNSHLVGYLFTRPPPQFS